MSAEWGPWIEHDGGSVEGLLRLPCVIHYYFDPTGIASTADGQPLPLNWPGFLWRWRYVRAGWFSTELRRVCDDPEYAPIVRYRIRKPRGLSILERIAANPADKIAHEHQPLVRGDKRTNLPVGLGRSFGSARFSPLSSDAPADSCRPPLKRVFSCERRITPARRQWLPVRFESVDEPRLSARFDSLAALTSALSPGVPA